MKNSNQKAVLYLSDGVFANDSTLVLATGFLKAPDAATSRLLMLFDDGWASHNVTNDFIVSVTFSENLGRVFALGRNGMIKSVGEYNVPFDYEHTKGKWRETWLQRSGERGNMTRIRSIGKTVYACGWGSQIYRLEDGVWEGVFGEQKYKERVGFLDIHGTSENDIYAIGMDGIVYHYDGLKWSLKDLGTNCNFHCMLCKSKDEVYIAGSEGALYLGAHDKWSFIGEGEFKENIWSIEEYVSEIYFSFGNRKIGAYNGKHISFVGFGLENEPSTHRLTHGRQELWSIGAYDLVRFDGSRWRPTSWPVGG